MSNNKQIPDNLSEFLNADPQIQELTHQQQEAIQHFSSKQFTSRLIRITAPLTIAFFATIIASTLGYITENQMLFAIAGIFIVEGIYLYRLFTTK